VQLQKIDLIARAAAKICSSSDEFGLFNWNLEWTNSSEKRGSWPARSIKAE